MVGTTTQTTVSVPFAVHKFSFCVCVLLIKTNSIKPISLKTRMTGSRRSKTRSKRQNGGKER